MENGRVAMLIDGDNADANIIEQMINETSKFGRVTIKRIYADFTLQSMNSWKKQLNTHAIRPIQKFQYTTGKNSTDSALIIDAMDILHAKQVDSFCIVSSDSDYTGIAHRIREEGLQIIGIGQSHTPEAFVKACDNFIYTEILKPQQKGKEQILKSPLVKKDSTAKPALSRTNSSIVNVITGSTFDMEIIDNAFQMVYDELTDSALASKLGPAFKKVDPTFDIRNYGFTSFRKFLESLKPNYEVVLHEDKKTISLKKLN